MDAAQHDCVSNCSDNEHGIEIRVFEGLQNASQVREFLDKNNSVAAWACAVDLAKVTCVAQLICAAAKTAARMVSLGPFKTGTARGDVYYNASHHTNIAEALRLMQISAETADVAIVSVKCDSHYLNSVYSAVRGTEVNACEWFADTEAGGSIDRLDLLAKYYKLTPQEMKISSVQDCVMTKIAAKEFIK